MLVNVAKNEESEMLIFALCKNDVKKGTLGA